MIAALGLVWGVVLAAVAGGDLMSLGALEIRHRYLIGGLFVLQGFTRGRLFSDLPASQLAVPVWGLCGVILLLLLWRNRQVPMLWIAGVGLFMNTWVVLLNSGMPVVAREALLPATSSAGSFYHLGTSADLALVLSDVLPAPGGLVLSLGDLALLVGVAALIVRGAAQGEHT